MYRSSKTIGNLPCAHRRWRHNGHCKWVHGYSRSFEFWFESDNLDEMGFVVDFGGLKWLQEWLLSKYDHTLLIDESDPLLPMFLALEQQEGCKLTVYENVGMEGSAEYVGSYVKGKLEELYGDRVRLISVECRENDKNSGGIWYSK